MSYIFAMVPDRVIFSGFVVEDPRVVLSEQPLNRPAFWPSSWYIVPEPGTIESNVFTGKINNNYLGWLRKNCHSPYDYIHDSVGRRIFAFESDEEAVLFKLTF